MTNITPTPPAAVADLIHTQIEAAARTLAECMDYPWTEMPEDGKRSMRAHAVKVVRAALSAAAPAVAQAEAVDKESLTVAQPQEEQSAFEDWLSKTCPSGDVTEVQRQWEASSEYADWKDQAGAESYSPSAAPQVVATAPQRIYLDLGFDPSVEDAPFSTLHEVTWSTDNASGHGIEYVRADATAALRARGAVPSDYLRIAELVRHARDNRGSKDWPLMHTDLSEAAEIADKLAATPAAPMSAQAPSGWKLVPVKPTDAMLLAGYTAVDPDVILVPAWDRMLAAAPQPPAALPGGQDAALIEALRTIAEWKLPETGKFWEDDPQRPVSFSAAYGSNGARGYMQAVAARALASKEQQ